MGCDRRCLARAWAGPPPLALRRRRQPNIFALFWIIARNDRSAANGKPVPLDFISYHPKGRTRLVDGHVEMGLAEELQSVEAGFRIVAGYPRFRHLPIILSEADPEGCAACSAREHPADAYRNGPLYASYTAAALKSMLDLEAEDQVNLRGMVTWAFEFENGGCFEGLRSALDMRHR